MCEREGHGGDLSLFESKASTKNYAHNATDLVKISFERNLTFVRNGFFQPPRKQRTQRTDGERSSDS